MGSNLSKPPTVPEAKWAVCPASSPFHGNQVAAHIPLRLPVGAWPSLARHADFPLQACQANYTASWLLGLIAKHIGDTDFTMRDVFAPHDPFGRS